MPSSPRVSVITTVYNGEPYLAAAIESILAQTLTDFEYFIVDDGSSDNSRAIIADYAARDPRIVPLYNPVNLNMSGALNRALALARGDYYANLDQDDLAYPTRLAQQVAFLDAHPEVGVLGAQAVKIDAAGQPRGPLSYPTDPEHARWTILFYATVLHSAAMMRLPLVRAAGGYAVNRWYVNDYILFADLLRTTQIQSLPETLVARRIHDQQTASVFAKPQTGQAWLLIYSMLVERLGLRAPLGDVANLYSGLRGSILEDAAALIRAADLLLTIRDRYREVEKPSPATAHAVDTDCAVYLLTMAQAHRRAYRELSRTLLQQALDLDPHLWQRPSTRAWLRSRRPLANRDHR